MWSRSTLKQNAKNVLRGNYWMAFLVCLLASVLTGGLLPAAAEHRSIIT